MEDGLVDVAWDNGGPPILGDYREQVLLHGHNFIFWNLDDRMATILGREYFTALSV